MRNSHKSWLFQSTCFICAMALSGCLKTRSEVSQAEERKNFEGQLVNLQKQKADETARFNELENSLRELNGRLEAMEYQQKQMTEGENQKSISAKLDAITEQLKVFEQEDLQMKQRLAALEAGGVTKKKKRRTTSWQRAENELGKKRWAQALLGYKEYQERNPKGRRWALANYKIGVCFQEMGKLANAKLFFQETIERFPKTKAARKAKYRLDKLKSK